MTHRKPPRWVSSFPPHRFKPETWVPLDPTPRLFDRESPVWDVAIIVVAVVCLVTALALVVSPFLGPSSWLYF